MEPSETLPTMHPAPPGPDPWPVRTVVVDPALERNRLTVIVRLVLAIPLLIWAGLWSVFAGLIGIVAWFVVVVTARLPLPLQEFFASYVRFIAHVNAYVSFAADRYPSFAGRPGYAVDIEIDPVARHRRWTAAIRLVLALPALVLASALAGSVPIPSRTFGEETGWNIQGGALLGVVAVLGWATCLIRGRMAAGMRDLAVYAIGYGAQVTSYLLFLTDRYPSADPGLVLPARRVPHHPVRLRNRDDLGRARLMVFLRAPLSVPHLVWLTLWSALVLVISPAVWVIVLVLGRLPVPLHRFLAAWTRALGQFSAFASLVGGSFPGFVGAAGYPVDITIEPASAQNRAVTVGRIVLAIPAVLLASAYANLLFVVAVLLWLAGLATGRAPAGLQALGAAAVRYLVQEVAYLFLVTDRYPYSSPFADADDAATSAAAATVPAAPTPEGLIPWSWLPEPGSSRPAGPS